jgi:hypothetical protein
VWVDTVAVFLPPIQKAEEKLSVPSASGKRRAHWPAIVLYCLGVLSFSADFIVEEVTPDSGGGRVTRLILSSVFHYRTFARAGYRTPRAHFVRLVTLERGKEPPDVLPVPGNPEETTRHICDQRLLMAKLVDALRHAHAGVIVLDKYFTPLAECPDSDPRTQALLAAVQDASRDIPVIVGADDNS